MSQVVAVDVGKGVVEWGVSVTPSPTSPLLNYVFFPYYFCISVLRNRGLGMFQCSFEVNGPRQV